MRAIIHEGVAGACIGIEFMDLCVFTQLGFELLHFFRGRILVILTKMPHDWALDLRGALER